MKLTIIRVLVAHNVMKTLVINIDHKMNSTHVFPPKLKHKNYRL